MEVKLAKSAGFCWGVKRAIDMALELRSQSGASIQTLGPLIHNPQTLEMLQSKSIQEVDTVADLSRDEEAGQRANHAGGNGSKKSVKNEEAYVVIRAHGIPPETRQELRAGKKQILDATCPDVGLIHGLIRKFVRRGYDIIILGDAKHPEVIGLNGYSEGRGHVLNSIEKVALLPDLDKVYVVAQSTLDGETWLGITQAIQERWPQAEIRNTICDATTDRQTEVMELSKEVDIMVVVGGRASSNTKKLVKIARRSGIPAYQVETEEEVQDDWFHHTHAVGVTAGASTPNWLIMKVVKHIEDIEEMSDAPLHQGMVRFLEFTLQNHLLLSLGAMALAYVSGLMMGGVTGSQRLWAMSLAGVFIYSMHTFHGSRELGTFRLKDLFDWDFYRKGRWPVFLRSGIAFFFGLGIAFHLDWQIALFYSAVSFLGFGYRLEILPEKYLKFIRYRSLMAIPGSRDIFVAMAWATIIVGLPAWCLGQTMEKGVWESARLVGLPILAAFIFVAGLVFVRSLVSDERDIKRDKLIGRETLPIVLGAKKTIRLHWLVLCGLAALLLFWGLMPNGNSFALVLLPALVLTYLYVHFYHYKIRYRSLFFDLLIDTKFLAIGAWAYAWLHWIN